MKIVCISDTHMLHDQLVMPEGDVLIHSGDFTNSGTIAEVENFARWLAKQPYAIKVVVPGNHDEAFDRRISSLERFYKVQGLIEDIGGAVLLIDNLLITGLPEIGPSIKIYGTPWSKLYGDWAFMDDDAKLMGKWNRIPPNLDILVVHGPPKDILDKTYHGHHEGSDTLKLHLETMGAERPSLVVFGHIHESHGMVGEATGDTIYVNAASMGYREEAGGDPNWPTKTVRPYMRPPIVVEL